MTDGKKFMDQSEEFTDLTSQSRNEEGNTPHLQFSGYGHRVKSKISACLKELVSCHTSMVIGFRMRSVPASLESRTRGNAQAFFSLRKKKICSLNSTYHFEGDIPRRARAVQRHAGAQTHRI